jgi:hypothetical protein
LYSDDTAVAWQRGSTRAVSLATRPAGDETWIFEHPVGGAACDANRPSSSAALESACAALEGATGDQPSQTNASSASYPTRNGPKTIEQLQNELIEARYGRPWDVNAMLNAYDRATAPTAKPQPTATPIPQPRPTATPGNSSSVDVVAFAQRNGWSPPPYLTDRTQIEQEAARYVAVLQGICRQQLGSFDRPGQPRNWYALPYNLRTVLGQSCLPETIQQWLAGN